MSSLCSLSLLGPIQYIALISSESIFSSGISLSIIFLAVTLAFTSLSQSFSILKSDSSNNPFIFPKSPSSTQTSPSNLPRFNLFLANTKFFKSVKNISEFSEYLAFRPLSRMLSRKLLFKRIILTQISCIIFLFVYTGFTGFSTGVSNASLNNL